MGRGGLLAGRTGAPPSLGQLLLVGSGCRLLPARSDHGAQMKGQTGHLAVPALLVLEAGRSRARKVGSEVPGNPSAAPPPPPALSPTMGNH